VPKFLVKVSKKVVNQIRKHLKNIDDCYAEMSDADIIKDLFFIELGTYEYLDFRDNVTVEEVE